MQLTTAIKHNPSLSLVENYIKNEEFLFDELTHANISFNIFLQLHNKFRTEIDLINISPCFFQVTLNSLKYKFSGTLCKIYDTYNKNEKPPITINSILRLADIHKKELFSDNISVAEKITEFKKTLAEKNEDIINLKIIRDKYIGHNDKICLKEDILASYSLSRDKICDLINLAYDILMFFRVLRGESYIYLNVAGQDDVEVCLDYLKKYKSII